MSADNQQERLDYFSLESSETTRQIPRKQALSILIGLLYTDGCVSPKGKSWRIYFVNKSIHLIALFKDCMISSFANLHPNVRIGNTSDGFHKAVVYSKIIGNFLTQKFSTFRTLKFKNGQITNARLPIDFLETRNQVKVFLQAAFSCDGGLCFYPAKRSGSQGGTTWLIRTVFLACAHSALRVDYLSLIERLGIKAREVPKDGKIKLENEFAIRKFAKYVGFVKGSFVTLHSKYWIGYEKNHVLQLMLNSYKNPAKYYKLQKFVR